jgi:hypothetical protein
LDVKAPANAECGTRNAEFVGSSNFDYNLKTMAKAEIKTKVNDASVDRFLNAVTDEQQRADAFKVLDMMKRISGEEPKMWGASIVGFGEKTYKSPATDREVDWFRIGFSPRKENLSLYILHGSQQQEVKLLDKLGKHKTGKGCLYIKRLSDVDERVLEKLVKEAMEQLR